MSDDLAKSLHTITQAGTRKNNRLPAADIPAAIPERIGASPPIEGVGSTTVTSSDLTLGGPKVFASADGILVCSFPESALITVGPTTITIPAIVKTP